MQAIGTIEFELPMGYRDQDGRIHRQGVMRLATAGDEILPLKDHRVRENPGYLPIIVLARVVVSLGDVPISTSVIENLYHADFHYLQLIYNKVNGVVDDGVSLDTSLSPGNVEALSFQNSSTQR